MGDEMICDYCHKAVARYRVEDNDADVLLCLDCKRDVDYCRAGGRILQNPEDAS